MLKYLHDLVIWNDRHSGFNALQAMFFVAENALPVRQVENLPLTCKEWVWI